VTVDRIDEEIALLQLIADGDGELVTIEIDRDRQLHILKDLEAAGYVAGHFTKSDADLRITSAGERHLMSLKREQLAAEQENELPTRAKAAASTFMEKAGWQILVGLVLLGVGYLLGASQ
jgi:hypothetical protein